jgi:two-component system cell cycle response regulator DivK
MTRRILLVEDTEDNRQIVRDLMESVGYDLIEAADGAAGVAMAAEHRPDLILMDIQLPVMDGYEACRRISGPRRLGAHSSAAQYPLCVALTTGEADWMASTAGPRRRCA